MSWALQVDAELIDDNEALDELINLDGFYANGYHEHVEQLIYRTIPEKDKSSKGEILINYTFAQLKMGSIDSPDFVSQFIDFFINEIEENDEICSNWISKVFNENNGYGFINMSDMSIHDLVRYLQKEIDMQKLD